MKLSKEDKRQLVALGHAYVAAVEKYASNWFFLSTDHSNACLGLYGEV